MISTPVFALEFGLITIRVLDNQTNQPIPNIILRLNPPTPAVANAIGLHHTAPIALTHTRSELDAVPVFIRHTQQKIHFATNDDQHHHIHGVAQNNGYEFRLEAAPKQSSSKPITIPTPHVIPIHCDHHANKLFAWLHISNTPWIAPTNRNGEVFFNLPAGDYSVSNWHADLPNGYYLSNTSLTITPRDFANTFVLTAAKNQPRAPTIVPIPLPTPVATTTNETMTNENPKKSRRRYHRR